MPGLTSTACLSPYECGIKFNIHFNLPLWALSFLPPPPPPHLYHSLSLAHSLCPAMWKWWSVSPPLNACTVGMTHYSTLGQAARDHMKKRFPPLTPDVHTSSALFPPLHFQSLNLLSLLQFSRTTIPLIKSYNLHVSQSCLHRRFSKFQWPIANTGTFPME